MKFNFSKKQLRGDLFFGLLLLSVGLLSLVLDPISAFPYIIIVLGGLTLYKYRKNSTQPYLILEKEVLSIEYLFGYKKINVTDYTEISKSKNSLILKNKNKKKKIWIWQAEKGTPELLFSELSKLIHIS
jgi:hypothetical protein